MTQTMNGRQQLPKLHLSNGYFVNFISLARFLRIICQDQRKRIPRSDIAAVAGMTEKQVEYLGSIAQALCLIEPVVYKPTRIGLLVEHYDPHFDDKGTLWFLHYLISSNPHHLVWNRLVTGILPTYRNITHEQACNDFRDLHQRYTTKSIQSHISKELNAFLDAYTNQHFSRIAYLHQQGENYVLNKGEEVPPLILGACITCFLHRHSPNSTAISVEDLLFAPNGPGIVLQLEETYFRTLLEQLKWQPGFSLESRADLDQIRLTANTQDYEWMERYYASK